MKVGEFFDQFNDYVIEFDRNVDNEDVDIEDYDLKMVESLDADVEGFEINHERKEVILK